MNEISLDEIDKLWCLAKAAIDARSVGKLHVAAKHEHNLMNKLPPSRIFALCEQAGRAEQLQAERDDALDEFAQCELDRDYYRDRMRRAEEERDTYRNWFEAAQNSLERERQYSGQLLHQLELEAEAEHDPGCPQLQAWDMGEYTAPCTCDPEPEAQESQAAPSEGESISPDMLLHGHLHLVANGDMAPEKAYDDLMQYIRSQPARVPEE